MRLNIINVILVNRDNYPAEKKISSDYGFAIVRPPPQTLLVSAITFEPLIRFISNCTCLLIPPISKSSLKMGFLAQRVLTREALKPRLHLHDFAGDVWRC